MAEANDIWMMLYDWFKAGEFAFCRTAGHFYESSPEVAATTGVLKKLEGMRATQLRNLLLQDLHVSHNIVDKILDRNELKELARQSLSDRYVSDCKDTFFQIIITTAIIALLLVIVIMFQKYLKKYLKYVSSLFIDAGKFRQKLKLAKYCSRRFATYFGFIAILISIVLELLVVWINGSVILSWVTPRYWEIRKYLFFGFYLPVSADMLQSMVRGKPQGDQSSSFGGWSINIGSLITLAALKWICSKLDDFAAYQLMKFKESKEKEFLHNPFN